MYKKAVNFARMKKTTLPFIVTPNDGGGNLEELEGRIRSGEFENEITHTGAVLFRGFDVRGAEDFQRIAMTVAPDLQEQYLGTSPRESKSRYVFSASELPAFYPIMQHCEMSFLPSAPRKIFFYCKTAPTVGGETPLTDFRKVAASLNPKIRREFEQKGIRNIRNYAGPKSPKSFDLWSLKRWNEMFKTEDKTKVEAECQKQGFEYQWLKGDRLRLINTQPAFKTHPKTGETAWFNHLQVFHTAAAAYEYKKIAAMRPTLKNRALAWATKAMTQIKKRVSPYENHGTHCTFGDGSPIPEAYIYHVLDVIWQHLVPLQWQAGDVVAIDNDSIAHGRLPYSGAREVLVAWTGESKS